MVGPGHEYRSDSVRTSCEHLFVSSTRDAVEELIEAGVAPAVIARTLDLAPTSVEYHVSRLSERPFAPAVLEPGRAEGGTSRPSTRPRVAELLDSGCTHVEVARALGVSKATVSYHARRLGKSIDERCARRYDWDAVQLYYDRGHGVRACMEAFGFSAASWSAAVRRGAVVARPQATPIDEMLVADRYRGRHNLKARLLSDGLKENRCERCGIANWRDKPLTLALHHVNGVRNDNRLENLELLCPNCHSQTSTFAGRNKPRLTKPNSEGIAVADR